MAISVIYLTVFALMTYILQAGFIGFDNAAFWLLTSSYEYFGLISSLLMFLVALTPQKIINGIDNVLWASRVDNFFIYDNDDSYQDPKKGAK